MNYKPDLNEFITQCEINYGLILKLLPFLNKKQNSDLSKCNHESVRFNPKTGHQIDFETVEKAKFTTTMVLRLKTPCKREQLSIDLTVRLYHDVKLLEVMDEDGPKALLPRVKGKGLAKEQVDEKRQLNRFVGESLRHCLQG